MNVGDVVVSEKVRYHDVFCGEGNELGQVQDMPAEFETNAALINLALACTFSSNLAILIRKTTDQIFGRSFILLLSNYLNWKITGNV